MEEPETPESPESGAPQSRQGRRDAILRRLTLIMLVLVPCLWGVAWWLKTQNTASADPCIQVKICDPDEFKAACEGAGQYPEIESAVAVLGYVIEERCPENSMTCEVDLLGGRGPVEDGCVVVYERGTGRILESRWHRLAAGKVE